MFGLTTIRNWYGKFERPISSFSLIGGFVFDAIFLKRVDLFWENFWIFVHLAVVAICIVLINLRKYRTEEETDPSKLHFWYVNILQFFFGGLLSTFLVFYFRSATLSASWPFFLILGLAFVANERLKRHFSRLEFQISLLFLCLFSFLIFYVPVLVHSINQWTFVLSGFLSLVIITVFLRLLSRFSKENLFGHKHKLIISIAGIFLVMNVLYFTNIIPPLPLSLKDSGIYHAVLHNSNGDYVIQTENESWWQKYFALYPDFHLVSGDVVYAFSSVFSPESFNTSIVHEWQYFNQKTNDWTTEGKVSLSVACGRGGGYRTYSARVDLNSGHWRVNVLTLSGLVLGSLRFNVVPVVVEPILNTKISQ